LPFPIASGKFDLFSALGDAKCDARSIRHAVWTAMTDIIYDKTDKGHQEIQTRQNHLPSRLRSLLVLVDGKTSVEALLKKIVGLGLNEESIAELLQQGFITPHVTISTNPVDAPVSLPTPPIVAPSAPTAVPPDTPQEIVNDGPTSILADGESLYQALYNFYTTSIKSSLGLRGYALQLKVERCANVDDFKALRQTFLDAVLKSKGPDLANSFAQRLDQLLSLT
jgi:hypothetical protein